jgi:hypothetical protein
MKQEQTAMLAYQRLLRFHTPSSLVCLETVLVDQLELVKMGQL